MPIYDRTQENLSATDAGIVMTRRVLLKCAADYRDQGQRPAGVDDPQNFLVRAISVHLPRQSAWVEASAPFMKASLGADFGYAL